MSTLDKTNKIFYTETGMDQSRIARIIENGLQKADGGELFMEQKLGESFAWERPSSCTKLT